MSGRRFGAWTVMATAPSRGRQCRRYIVRCDCGASAIVYGWTLRKGKSTGCRSCGQNRSHAGLQKCVACSNVCRVDDGRCESCSAQAAPIDSVTRYEDDPAAQRFVAEHPGGAMLEEIADVLGVTRQRVQQIEASALRHMRARMKLAGVAAEDTVFTHTQHALARLA